MIKPITATVVCLVAMIAPAEAQTLSDAVVSQYGLFKKSNSAAKLCVGEVDRMQAERNGHYDTFVRAKAENPDAPTIEEMSDVLAQTYLEDAALNQKRQECTPLLDQLAAAARELRRNCEAQAVSTDPNNEPATPTDMLANNICHGSAKGGDVGKSGTQ